MKRAALLVLLGACGTSNDYNGINDGPATTVHLDTNVAASMVVFRDGTQATWTSPTQLTPSTWDLEVHGPYVVSVACLVAGLNLSPPTWVLQQLMRSPEDGTDVRVRCGAPAPTGGSKLHAHVVQDAQIMVGDQNVIARAGADLALDLAPGTYDLYAATSDKIAVRRAIVIDGREPDIELGSLDVDAEGAAFATMPLNITNNHGVTESMFVNLSLPTTATTYMLGMTRLVHPPEQAKIAPASIAGPGGIQRITVNTQDGRGITMPVTVGQVPEFRLPDALTLHWTPDNLAATWDELDSRDRIRLTAYGTTGTEDVEYWLTMTSSFRSDTGAERAAFDLDLPAGNHEWTMRASGADQSYFSTDRTVDGVTVFRDVMYPNLD